MAESNSDTPNLIINTPNQICLIYFAFVFVNVHVVMAVGSSFSFIMFKTKIVLQKMH